jgi:hypothetical protein
MTKYFLLFLLSISTYAAEYPQALYSALGEYSSKEAASHDDYLVNDIQDLSISLSPNGEIYLYISEYDEEIEVNSDMSFDTQLSECDDHGCAGIEYFSGKITFSEVNGVSVPSISVTAELYEDTSEDVDCDVVDCDNMDYSDFFRNWSVDLTYKFEGVVSDSRPNFISTNLNSELDSALKNCSTVLGRTLNSRCPKISAFKLQADLDESLREEVLEFLVWGELTIMDKDDAYEYMNLKLDVLLKDLKIFNSLSKEELEILENSFNTVKSALKNASAKKVYLKQENSRWSNDHGLTFVVFDDVTNEVTRLVIKE